ncbi:MAG: ORF6N domain-containing protein [Chitinispirillaceae bacterium]|nr:ORF6N domain-containing protein [Chitinispirillaceae bacterium]
MKALVPQVTIESRIHEIRGKKVILDSDLAALYEVETGQLKRAVRRNIDRFPDDFMFELTKDELENLRCQFGISSWGGLRYLPFAFTEQGVAMLSGVLNSKRAVLINIQIMRAFVRMRNLVADNTELKKVIQNIERRLGAHDQQIQEAFAALKSILQPPASNLPPMKEYSPDGKKRMGFGKR